MHSSLLAQQGESQSIHFDERWQESLIIPFSFALITRKKNDPEWFGHLVRCWTSFSLHVLGMATCLKTTEMSESLHCALHKNRPFAETSASESSGCKGRQCGAWIPYWTLSQCNSAMSLRGAIHRLCCLCDLLQGVECHIIVGRLHEVLSRAFQEANALLKCFCGTLMSSPSMYFTLSNNVPQVDKNCDSRSHEHD